MRQLLPGQLRDDDGDPGRDALRTGCPQVLHELGDARVAMITQLGRNADEVTRDVIDGDAVEIKDLAARKDRRDDLVFFRGR